MSPSSPASAISFSFSTPGVVLEQVADHQHPARPPRPRRPRARRRRPTAPAASRRSSACRPRARARRGRRGSARRWRPRRRRARRRRAGRRGQPWRARAGERGAQRARGLLASASQIQRSSAPGEPVEVAREVRAPVAEADDARPRTGARSQAHQVRGLDAARDAAEVDDQRRLATIRSRSRPGWAVTITAQSAPSSALVERLGREAELGQLGHVVVVVGELARRARAAAA